MVKITVDLKKCTGCGTCASVCPVGMYEIKKGKSIVIKEKIPSCLECRACEMNCPNKAIKVE